MSIRAIAVLWAFNEEDFIAWSIRHLLAQGIDVQVYDNWSTDRTFEKARASEEGKEGVRSFLEKRKPAWHPEAKASAAGTTAKRKSERV